MRIAAGCVIAFVISVALHGQPPFARPQFRCEVQSFTGAMSPGGAVARMTIVSDGLACTFLAFGVPDARRNPASSGEITDAPQHGNASFLGSAARYVADRGFVGPDTFAFRAVARDADNVERTLIVRVDVDVRGLPFDRTTTGSVAVLMPAGPVRVGNDLPVPRKVKDVRPVYPPDALSTRAQGVVVLDATIDTAGKVTATRVIRSVPALDGAAVAAVREWEFTPTIVDGRAVPIIMTLSVGFKAPEAAPTPAAAVSSPTPPAPPESAAPPPRAAPPAPVAAPVAAPPAARAGADRPARGTPADRDLESAFDHLQRRQFEDAVKAFKQANDQRGQQCAVCFVGMARAYEAMGAAKNVTDACDKALAVVGADKAIVVQAYQLKAVALQDLAQNNDAKRLHEAEDALRAALALDPSANYLHFNMGVVLLKEGRDADGVAELKEEVSLRPDSPHAQRARQMIENPRRAREHFAPEFSIVTLDREFLDLNGLKGKVVVLDFWGTWCPPCVTAVPTLRDLQKRHEKDPFVLLSVSSDSDEAVVRRFIDKNRMAWPQYWDRDRKVQQAFDVRAFPTYVVIDAEGIVRFRTSGGGNREPVGLESAIKEQLKAAGARSKSER